MTEPPGKTESSSQSSFVVPLSEDVEGALSFQSYEAAQRIDDVELEPLKKHRTENGWFTELFRLSNAGVVDRSGAGGAFALRQISSAFADPFRINAFHIHPKAPQRELWTVLQGALTVWLVDCRRDSATVGRRQRVYLSAEEPALLHIPPGVAHGYRAGAAGALLVYAMDQQFDREAPNEGRLPWDHFGAELWAEDRG